jgi:hypothetical protein
MTSEWATSCGIEIFGGLHRYSILYVTIQRNARLRNDIRRELILDEGDAIAQVQFALLEPLHLKQIGTGGHLQRFDGGVEVAMLLLQARKLRAELAFLL